MKKSASAALFLSPALIVLLLCFLWIYWLNPILNNWALSLVPKINSSQNNLVVSVKKIDFSILKMQAIAQDLTLQLKTEAFTPRHIDLSPVRIASAKVQLDLFSLIVGQLSISSITLDQLQSHQSYSQLLKLKNQNTKTNESIDLRPLFLTLEQLPVKKIIVQNSQFIMNVDQENHTHLREVEIKIKNLVVTQNRATLFLEADDCETLFTSKMKASVGVVLNLKAQLTENTYAVNRLQITHGLSSINITSVSKDLPSLLQKPVTINRFNLHLKLDEIKNLSYIFKEQIQRLPQLSGFIRLQGEIATDSLSLNRGSVEVLTEEVRFENLKFGNAKAIAKIKNSEILLDSILVEHPSGRAELKNISIQQEKPFNFKSDIIVQKFQLQKLFNSLNLSNIPADFNANAQANCSGQIEHFKVLCDTHIQAEKISVKPSFKDPFYIVQIDAAEAKGQVEFSLNEVKFKSDLQIGKSNVTASGEVDYQTGFKMNFNSNSLDLGEINNIANLGLKGIASGELVTSGTTEYGVIDSKINISDLIIDRFSLGIMQTNLKYAKSKLSLMQSTAHLNKTSYTGDVELDFNNSQIAGQFKLNPLYAEDILSAIKERWQLPLEAAGQGQGAIEFSGPLNFWQMKYSLKSDFQRGHIMNETFTKLNLDLVADGDRINFQNVILHKPSGTVQLSNHIHTKPVQQNPRLDLIIRSQNLKIEETDHISKYFPNSSGVLMLNGTMTSDVLTPLVQLQTQTKNLKIDNYPLPTSQGDVKLSLNYFNFVGQVFGRQLQLDLNIPFKDSEKFSMKAQARDFNPLVLLPLLNLQLPPSDTIASITADADLKADSLNFQKLSGSIQIENILLQRSSQFLKLTQPVTITLNKGLEKITPFNLVGAEQNLQIGLKNGSSSELTLDGRFFLRPLQFLVPFSDNLSGIAEVSCVFDLRSPQLNLSGEGLIDSASLSMKGFKYPINDINAYFDFSKSKIIFSEINATLNQTPISGQGQVDIKGAKNVDVQFNAETEKLEIDFPNQFLTSGTAQIQFFGQWLPYNLKINYVIDEGNITKEFTDENAEATLSLRPSPFLPAQQLSQKNQSLLLDVKADFSKGVIVKNRIVEGLATGIINVSGSPENPILQGRIDIQQGSRLIFKDKPFDIQLGHVTFNGDYAINPSIYITANARISDYDINLLIQGLAKNLEIKPSSQPSLSREDIFSLLALGYTASNNDQSLSSDAQQKQTGLEVLAALSNQSQLNKKLQQKLGLNVQLAPSIDSTRNIAVPKVIVSKKLTSKITTSYSRPLTGDQQENEVRLQYLWTNNLSVILNYQNQNSTGQTNILQNTEAETGVGGIDFEFKKEFGE